MGAFLQKRRMNPGVHPLELSDTGVSQQQLVGALATRLEGNFMDMSSPADEVTRLQRVVFDIFVSWEHAVERLFLQSIIIVNGFN